MADGDGVHLGTLSAALRGARATRGSGAGGQGLGAPGDARGRLRGAPGARRDLLRGGHEAIRPETVQRAGGRRGEPGRVRRADDVPRGRQRRVGAAPTLTPALSLGEGEGADPSPPPGERGRVRGLGHELHERPYRRSLAFLCSSWKYSVSVISDT